MGGRIVLGLILLIVSLGCVTSPQVQNETENCELTPSLTEGPYYKSGSPERSSLVEPGMDGTKIVISGRVLDENCNPVPGAWLDFWHADEQGYYDTGGYRLRGHQFADESGRYMLETIIPARYTGRTPHIHAKVSSPGGPALTTQIFFPGEERNEQDSIFNQKNLMIVSGGNAEFDFVVR